MDAKAQPSPDTAITPDLAVLRRLLAERHSCRAFLPRPVPRHIIEAWLDTAQASASWCNTQPWRVHVTEGEGTGRLVAALGAALAGGLEEPSTDFPFPDEYKGVSLARRREVGSQLYSSVGVARGDRAAGARQGAENFRLFGAPHVAVLTSERALGVYGAVDTGLYLGTLMLAAEALGIACIAQAALAKFPAILRQHLDLPEDRLVVCGVSFGYSDKQHPANGFRTRRALLHEVVTWVDGSRSAASPIDDGRAPIG